ncbi:MAG: hypothetical protein ACYCOX_18605 [Acidobacteriaceae bacterium]
MNWTTIRNLIKKTFIGEAYALDDEGNEILLDGNEQYTISAHCGSQILAKKPCLFCSIVCKVLGSIWTNHCADAWYNERKKNNNASPSDTH